MKIAKFFFKSRRKYCYLTVGILIMVNIQITFSAPMGRTIQDSYSLNAKNMGLYGENPVGQPDKLVNYKNQGIDNIEHEPIAIDGNDDFITQATSEGWLGDGSEGDPIIINNLLIKASDQLIWISNTNLHFQISSCVLDGLGGGTGGGGISFNNVSNCYIKNNTIRNFESVGIYLEQSFDCIINGNNVHHSTLNEGIFLWESGYNNISQNFVHDNELTGVVFHLSYHNLFSDNIISQNAYGITINSYNNMIKSNTFMDNLGIGISIDLGSSNNIAKWNNFVGNNQGSWQALNGGFSNVFINNYWDDQTGPDENSDGIVDDLYIIRGPIFNRDLFPLVNAHELQQPTLIYPNGGESLEDIITIRWSNATDSHGHDVIYTIYFSIDNGLTWTSIATDLTTTSYDWETRDVSSGTTYLIKVVGTCAEGLSAEDTSDGIFTINNRLSAPTLIYPTEGMVVKGTVIIQWTPAVDSEGHDITYSLFYSVDNGWEWILFVEGLETASYSWNTRGLPEDSSFLIKVVATSVEGLLTETIIGGTFIISNIDPPLDLTYLIIITALLVIIPELYTGRKLSNFVNRQGSEEGVEIK